MNLRVLVVEDDLPSLELMRTVLHRLHGVEVRTLSDSADAIAMIESEQFDGVFLDLMMPGLDGFELARLVRKSRLNHGAPIVIVTGREDASTMREAFAVGGTFFLQKPVDRQKMGSLFQSVRGAMCDAHRRMARMPLDTDVTCNASGHSFIGNSRNIGLGGMLIDAGRAIEVGALLRVEFRLPNKREMVSTTAVVERVDEKQRIDVLFTKLRASDRDFIRGLLDAE